jgi:hypothetical protein
MTDIQSDLADDDTHPIPSVHVYDFALTFAGGGARLLITIATPLDASARSLARLNEKLRFYIDSFWSEFGQREWGTPKEGKMKIYVNIHPESSRGAFERIDSFSVEAHSRGVDVEIMKWQP